MIWGQPSHLENTLLLTTSNISYLSNYWSTYSIAPESICSDYLSCHICEANNLQPILSGIIYHRTNLWLSSAQEFWISKQHLNWKNKVLYNSEITWISPFFNIKTCWNWRHSLLWGRAQSMHHTSANPLWPREDEVLMLTFLSIFCIHHILYFIWYFATLNFVLATTKM